MAAHFSSLEVHNVLSKRSAPVVPRPAGRPGLLAEWCGPHVLIRHRDETPSERKFLAQLPAMPREPFVMVSPAAHRTANLGAEMGGLLRNLFAANRLAPRALWLGIANLGDQGATCYQVAAALGVDVLAPGSTFSTVPGIGAYAGHAVGGSGWYLFRPGQPARLISNRYPIPRWERALPVRVLSEADTVVEPMPSGLLVRDPKAAATGSGQLACQVAVDARFPKLLIGGAPLPAPTAVARALGSLPEVVRTCAVLVPVSSDVARHAWVAELASRLGKPVVFATGPQRVAGAGAPVTSVVDHAGQEVFRPFGTLLRQPVGGGDQVVLDIAEPPAGWQRSGPRTYHPAVAALDGVVAEVVPSGLVLHSAGVELAADTAAVAAPFSPSEWVLDVGTAGESVGPRMLDAAERLLGSLDLARRATVRIRVSGRCDETAEAQVRRIASSSGVTLDLPSAPPVAPSEPPRPEPRPATPVEYGPSAPRGSVGSHDPGQGRAPSANPDARPGSETLPQPMAPAPSTTASEPAPPRDSAPPPDSMAQPAPVRPSAPDEPRPSAPEPPAPAPPVAAAAPVVTMSAAPVATMSSTPERAANPEPDKSEVDDSPADSGERAEDVETRTTSVDATAPSPPPTSGAEPNSGDRTLREPPAEPPEVADRASTPGEQARFTAASGTAFSDALATVNAAMATWPALRQGDQSGAKADYVAVCLYLGKAEGGARSINSAMRAGSVPELDGQLPCLVSGIRRLPTHRRVVLRQSAAADSAEGRSAPGTVLVEPGFLSASTELDVTVPGADVDVLIWPRAARRTSELALNRPLDEVVFLAGTRLKALAVRQAPEPDDEGPPIPRTAVLLRELAPDEQCFGTELDSRDLAALSRLDQALARRQRASIRLVDDPDAVERLTTPLVALDDVRVDHKVPATAGQS